VAPLALPDEQVLQVDPVAPGPGRVVEEPDRDRDDLPLLLDDVRVHRGGGAEQGLPQVGGRRLDRVRLALVLRQQADAVQDPVFVARLGAPQDGVAR